MTLLASFSHPVADAQLAFRRILKAMSEPGVIVTLPPLPAWDSASCAATAVLMTLVDGETPLYLDNALSSEVLLANLRFHTGAPVTTNKEAPFALLHGASDISLETFSAGSDLSPEKSTTVILEATALDGGTTLRLSGPGLKAPRAIAPQLPPSVLHYLSRRPHRFPQGIDLILACGENLMALPRTTHVEVC